MKKYLLMLTLALGMNANAGIVAVKADLHIIADAYDWLQIYVQDDLKRTALAMLDGDYTDEKVSVMCFEGGHASSLIDNLENYLNYLDENEEMLYDFPRKKEYAQLRDILSSWDDALGLKECELLIAAKTTKEAKPVLEEMLNKFMPVPFDGLELINELYQFKKTWVPKP